MNTKRLIPALLAAASLTASFQVAAQWEDAANKPAEAPPEELVAAAAAAAAPGAAPVQTAQATPAPAEAAPAPAAAPAAAVAPAPVAAPAIEEIRSVTPVVTTWHTAKATAIVLHNATLRSRPTMAGTGDTIVSAETRVRMESSVSNADGTWWFVTATGIGGGWMLESELGDPQR